jgi:hypothetical protein
MAIDHEKLDVYRLPVLFSSWVGERLENLPNDREQAPQPQRRRPSVQGTLAIERS